MEGAYFFRAAYVLATRTEVLTATYDRVSQQLVMLLHLPAFYKTPTHIFMHKFPTIIE